MTTTQRRLKYIEPAIRSALAQTHPVEHVELHLSMDIPHSAVPAWLLEESRVRVCYGTDYGPLTKSAHALWAYRREPNVSIWTLDDDFILPPHRLQQLADWAAGQKPTVVSAVGSEWWPRHMSFQGYGSVLYPPQCVGEDFMQFVQIVAAERACRANDDVTMTFYLKRRGIPIEVCPGARDGAIELDHSRDLQALHRNTWDTLMDDSLAFMRERFGA
jgi:hypothetical protein